MDRQELDGIRKRTQEGVRHAGEERPRSCSVDPRARKGQELARFFDHTLLKQDAPRKDFLQLYHEATEWQVYSVCIPPNRVADAVKHLGGSGVAVCTVIGFPNGYSMPRAKAEEVRIALGEGCDEFDTVLPIGILKDRNVAYLYRDIAAVVDAAEGRLVKVILETGMLTDEEKIIAGTIAIEAGACMLKTSTGFAGSGATVADVALLRQVAGERIGIKASGGVRSRSFAEELIAAGADRIGASSTGAILREAARDE